MKKTILSEYSNLLLTIYRMAQESPVHEFQDMLLSAIKPYLPFDSSMWGTATMTPGGIDIHSIHLHNSSQTMLDEYAKVKSADTAAVRMTAHPVATCGFNVDVDFPDPGQEEFRQFLHDFGHRNFFITSDLNPITKFVHWVSLYREDAHAKCTEDETQLLAYLAPHIMQALAINRLVHLDRLTGDVAREKWSVAIADPRGVLYHSDERFAALVDLEWPAQEEKKLPQELLDSLLGDEQQIVGRHVVVRRSLEHGILFLKARQKELVDHLSSRELLIAQLLASGLSKKEVATKLERSPETIRSHVKVIFEKLNINNVTMLAPLLSVRD